MRPPFRVALTGGIATGKSYCARRFHELGVPVIDADDVARDVVRPGTPALAAIRTRFGADVIGANGALDRPALGRLVFADAAARRDLEAIIHPRVYDAIVEWFEAVAAEPTIPVFAIAEIPLLYETGNEAAFGVVVVAACTPAQQLERLMARGGLTEDEARDRIGSQWPIADKASRAGIVIDTAGTFAATDEQVERAVVEITARAVQPR